MPTFLPNSLTHRLTLIYTVLVIVLVGLSFLTLYLVISHVLATRLSKDLSSDATEFQEIYRADGLAGVIEEMNEEAKSSHHGYEFLILFDSSGSTVYSSDLTTWPDLHPDLNAATRLGIGPQNTTASSSVIEFESKESPVHVVSDQLDTNYTLVIGEVAEDNEEILELLFIALFIVFAIALPLVLTVVWIMTRQAVSGIHAVSGAADQISGGNLDVRVNARGQVLEIQNLSNTFDAMAVRIQRLNKNTREMMDNIAHDMRSPLGRIRLFAEALINEDSLSKSLRCSAISAIADCDHLIDMINTSLDVSETEVGVSQVDVKPLDFHLLVADVFELFEPAAKDKGLSYNLTIPGGSIILGDSSSLQRMMANLLDNAVKFTPSGGDVLLELGVTNDMVEVRLTNTGIELSKSMQERVFDRFYRGDKSRGGSGTGLGLSFVRAVVIAHNGKIEVRSTENRVEFVVHIPLIGDTSNAVGNSTTVS